MNEDIKIKVLKETAKIEPFEYVTPEEETLQILREDGLEGKEIPPLESSWIDDYMIRYFSKYPKASEQDAVDSFLRTDYPAQIDTRLQNLLGEIDDGMYEKLLNETADVKTFLTEKALSMGAKNEDVEKLEDIELHRAVGTSMAGSAKLGQVLRKAKDYVAVFTEESFDDVLAAETRLTLGHEYGHQMCRAIDVPSSEMNAEFWGRSMARNEKESEIMRKTRAVMVAKSHQVISAIKQANLQNITSIMAIIADKTSENFPLLSQLAIARADIYGGHYAENYASPTSEEEMIELIKKANNKESEADISSTSISEISQDAPEFKKYFDGLGTKSTNYLVQNILNTVKDGSYLYSVSKYDNEPEQLRHIFWILRDPAKSIPYHHALDSEEYEEVASSPELVSSINQILLEEYEKALGYYAWKHNPSGLVIEHSDAWGMESGAFTGVRISYKEISYLLKALRDNNPERIKKNTEHIGASLVHELTHREREEIMGNYRNEIASHINQFLFNPENHILNNQFSKSLSNAETSDKTGLDNYDKASYISLTIIAEELAKISEAYKALRLQDQSALKVNSLRDLNEKLTPEDLDILKRNLIPKIMGMSNDELIDTFAQISPEGKNIIGS
jgi:hypothetical protein